MKLPGTKRILPLILSVLLLPALLAVPAHAEEISSTSWIDLIDFGTANNSGGNYVVVKNPGQIVTYDIPFDSGTLVGSIDIIFRCNQGSTFTGMKVSNGVRDFEGNLYNLGNGLYRFVCNGAGYRFLQFQIKPTITVSDNHYFEFISVRISQGFYEPQELWCSLTGILGNGDTISATYTGASTYTQWYGDPENFTNGQYSTYIRFNDDWRKFDFIDVLLVIVSNGIESIVADDGFTSLPIEVNQVYQEGGAVHVNTLVSVRIDVRSIDKNGDCAPILRITGASSTSLNHYAISSCSGMIEVDPPSPLVFWFNQLFDNISGQTNSIVSAFESKLDEFIPLLTDWTQPIPKALNSINNNLIKIRDNVIAGFTNLPTWISEQTTAISNAISTWGQNIVDAIVGNFDPSGIQSGIDSAVGELNQAGAALDAVQRPDIGQIDINVVGMLDPSGLAGLSSIVALFTGNTLIYRIIFMFLTLALISYVLYGKR